MRTIAYFALLTAIVSVQTLPNNAFSVLVVLPADYIENQAAGKAYRLVYQSRAWSAAKQLCEQEGAKLAVPKTQDEFQFIQKLIRNMYYPDVTGTTYKFLAWVGINNLDNYKVWKNLDGENIESSGYHTFSGNNGNGFSDDPAEPHCVGIDQVNPGLRDWWCHRQQPYVCEKAIINSA